MEKVFTHCPVKLPSIRAKTLKSGERSYTVPGKKVYPSVTTILSEHSREGIAKWRAKVGNSTADFHSKNGTERGQRFHDLTEGYLRNKGYVKPKSYLEIDAFQSVLSYLHRIDNIRLLESGLWSDELRAAGRTDCIGEFDGTLSIIDFKTAKKPKQPHYIHAYYMQEAAYAFMFEERTGIHIEQLVTIIAVDGQGPQLFFEKQANWIDEFIKYRDIYEMRQLSSDQ